MIFSVGSCLIDQQSTSERQQATRSHCCYLQRLHIIASRSCSGEHSQIEQSAARQTNTRGTSSTMNEAPVITGARFVGDLH